MTEAYPNMSPAELMADFWMAISDVARVGLNGLRMAMARGERITDEDRKNAEQQRQKLGKDPIPPRGSDTSTPEGGETTGRRTVIPTDKSELED